MTKNLNKNNIEVVIPVYNGERFILDAINSAVFQTLSPTKIIVVDDGSTDNTNSIVSEYAKTSKVEIKIVSKINGGLSSARNAGILASTAEFIAFLDADDTWVESKLEEQIKVYKNTQFTNLALVYCDYDVMDSNGIIKYKNYKAPLDGKRMRGMVFEELLERNKITSSGSGVLIKREVFDTVGLFDEKLKWGEDWDMWLRIAQKFEVDFANSILVHIRKNESNMTSNPVKVFEGEVAFYDKWISILGKRYTTPIFWSDKIAFRIISRFPKKDFHKKLQEMMVKENYKKLFRKSFGSFWLYIPIFIVRQILNMIFYPKYLSIATRFIKHKGV